MTDKINEGVKLLRHRWPQTHAVPSEFGHTLITVPSVELRGYDKDICTVLFVAPAGFPATPPNGFFTDIEIRLANGHWPTYTKAFNANPLPYPEEFARMGFVNDGSVLEFKRIWPQWSQVMRWWWRLQAWDPNRSGLVTYMNVIRQRLEPAR